MYKRLVVVTLLFVVAVALLIFMVQKDKLKEVNQEDLKKVTVSPVPKKTTTPSTANNTPKPSVTTTVQPQKQHEDMDFVFPKKGLRPIAVMIDNAGDRVLPQGGLAQAQVVYEILVEYGITRYMPIYWGDMPDMIGPVRSSRHYFLDYVMEYDAIYVHVGGSPMAYRDIDYFKINHMDGTDKEEENYFHDITSDPNNWQDTYISAKKINRFIKNLKLRTTTKLAVPFVYNKEDTALDSAKRAKEIFIKYNYFNNCGYYYDEEKKLYRRLRMGKPHIERNTGKQIEVKNIIIQFAQNDNIPGDDKGRQNIQTTGSGRGWYITDGRAEEITWEKARRDSKTQYRNKQGKTIKLNPGQTWIQIVPVDGKIVIK